MQHRVPVYYHTIRFSLN
uniref:Uncharacterized protein n=1 Tax=Arundo donax TaxID=35708 RepID=A0A0A8ZGB3_ARUDO